MIANDQELQVTLDRIAWFQKQVAHMRKHLADPGDLQSVGGFAAEIDRMELEVREYFGYAAMIPGSKSIPRM